MSVGQIAQVLQQVHSKAIRKDLDVQPHYVPLNLEILNITLGKAIIQNPEQVFSKEDLEIIKEQNIDISDKVISLPDLKRRIEDYVVKTHKHKIYITGSEISVNGTKKVSLAELVADYTPAVVYSNGKIVGALYPGYNSAQRALFTNFLNKEIAEFLDKSLYVNTNYKIGFDVGHLLGNSKLAKTPLAEKFKKLIEILNSMSDLSFTGISSTYLRENKTGVATLKGKVESALNKLYNNSSYGVQIETELEKDFDVQSFLLSIKANVVVIQDRFENQAVYANLLEGPLGRQVADLMTQTNFSKTLVEELDYRVFEILQNNKTTFTKTKSKKAVPTVKQKGSRKLKLTASTPTDVRVKTSTRKVTGTAPAAESLTNLQAILDSQLVDRVKANMGTGNSRNVLNLRSGRLAESVKIEYLSESRQGMITAFYTYMKNPYATFSEGGRQSNPRSRDPKLLISRSIRELIAGRVANRLRAVVV